MITLEDISIQNLYDYLIERYGKNNDLVKIIVENNIENYGQLENLVNKIKYNKDINVGIFRRFLSSAIDNLETTNSLTEGPNICKFNTYNNSKIDINSLEKTDKETSCTKLIYFNPTRFYYSSKMTEFNKLSIYQAKYLLSRGYISKTQKGLKGVQNALIANIKNLGYKDIPRLEKTIKFYEEQVIRQAQELGLEKVNYFNLNKEEKELIIRDNYEEIMEYIVLNANNYIWGELTPPKKEIMLHSIDGTGNYRKVKDNFVNIFSDYTTLSELENEDVKTKVLKRFIIE